MIATVARLLCRELTLQNECLRLENRILREKLSGRIRFTDEERRPLMRMSSAHETAMRALRGTDEFLDTTASCSAEVEHDHGVAVEPVDVHPHLIAILLIGKRGVARL